MSVTCGRVKAPIRRSLVLTLCGSNSYIAHLLLLNNKTMPAVGGT